MECMRGYLYSQKTVAYRQILLLKELGKLSRRCILSAYQIARKIKKEVMNRGFFNSAPIIETQGDVSALPYKCNFN